MIQLIKQILKSFKKSIMLLFGLIFIAFAIVFSSISSLYLSSNIENSYTTLNNDGNASDAILDTSDSNLQNDNFNDLLYDFDLLEKGLKESDFKQPINGDNNNPIYFNSFDDYVNQTSSFLYQPAQLAQSVFHYVQGKANYLFDYYIKGSNNTPSNNPYFTGNDINNSNKLWEKRAKGIIKSYGDVEIPATADKWRASGAELIDANNDPKNIDYAIDPLTGLTKKPNANGLIDSFGYFDNGLFLDSMKLRIGNFLYPQDDNVMELKDLDSTSIVANKNYQFTITKDQKDIPTPLFLATFDTKIRPDLAFDLTQYGDQTTTIAKILEMINNGIDAFNIISSIAIGEMEPIPLGNIDWDLANISPLYDYIKILHNPLYITDAKMSSFGESGEAQSSLITFDKNSYVFNIHIDENKLTQLQKETLDYWKAKDKNEYNNLTRFLYPVKSIDIKNELLNRVSEPLKEQVNKLNMDNLKDLQTKVVISDNPDNSISGSDIILSWMKRQASEEQKKFVNTLRDYEKEYISYKLSQINGIEFNNQKSLTITDSKSSNKFLVSQKDKLIKNEFENTDVNNLLINKGINLQSSKNVIDATKNIFKTTYIKQNEVPVNSIGWSPNANGNYFINYVEIINKSSFRGMDQQSLKFISDLSTEILNDYKSLGSINLNSYFKLMSIVNPSLSANNNGLVTYDNQSLAIDIHPKFGTSTFMNFGELNYSTPYANAAIVTDKWLEVNNKQIIPINEWQKAISLNTKDFNDWVTQLPDKFKFSINSKTFVILGYGQSPENAFPILSVSSPIPNFKNESLIFVNKQGYETILATSPSIYQDDYFSIKFNNKQLLNDQNINIINKELDGLVKKGIYSVNDINGNKNLLTLRFYYPKMINNFVKIFSFVLMILLILIGIYLSYVMVKIYVNNNQVSLAIIRANGMPKWKIVLSLSCIGLFVAIISGLIGYLVAFFLQPVFLSVLSNYWFIPIVQHNFSGLGLIGGGALIYLFFVIFITISVSLLFKQTINNLISKNTDIRINKLLHIIKSSRIKMPVTTKFTLSLILNKIGKFSLYIILCSLTVSIIAVGVTTPIKFDSSKQNTLDNRAYSYSFDLETPSSQSGLYKIQDYKELGTVDESIGIPSIFNSHNVSWNQLWDTPYKTLWDTLPNGTNNENNRDLFALRDLNGNIKTYGPKNEKRYFSNIVIPSYMAASKLVLNDINFFRNAVFTKWLLDFDITLVTLSINVWDYVRTNLSQELISRIDTISNQFVNEFMSYPEIAKANQIGAGSESNPKPFLVKDESGTYRIQSENVIGDLDVTNIEKVRLNNAFLKFIGMIYGQDELSEKDTKISYGIIPKNDEMETYTYIDGILNMPKHNIPPIYNDGKSELIDVNQKIVGINSNSNYVRLQNDKEQNLNDKLKTKVGNYYPLIINNGAMLQYNLKIGDIINVVPQNVYDRYTLKMENKENNTPYQFKVVDISNDSFGISLYTSQSFANEILGMNFDQGATIVENMIRDNYSYDLNSKPDTSKWKLSVIGDPNKIENSTKYPLQITPYSVLKDYVPFNGIYSKEQDPLFLNSITMMSKSGLWANFSSFNSDAFLEIAEQTPTFIVLNAIVPTKKDDVISLINYINENEKASISLEGEVRANLIDYLVSKYTSNDKAFWIYLDSIFGATSIKISVNTFDYFSTTFETFGTLFNTFITISNLLIVLTVPIAIIVITIICSVMLNEFRKMFLCLKTLGYSDKQSIMRVLITFVPVLIISLLIGLLILYIALFAIQASAFNLSTIFLSSSINWLPFLYGSIAIIAILLINIIYVVIFMKKQNLRTAIS